MSDSSIQTKAWRQQLPNQLTLFRIAVAPFLLVVYPMGFGPLSDFAACLFALACMTDWADGYFARKFEASSRLGATLDQIADKVLSGAGLLLIVQAGTAYTWIAGLLLCREIAVTGMRLVAAENQLHLPVMASGKWKSALMDMAIFCLLIRPGFLDLPVHELGTLLLWAALFLSLYSAWEYGRSFWKKLDF